MIGQLLWTVYWSSYPVLIHFNDVMPTHWVQIAGRNGSVKYCFVSLPPASLLTWGSSWFLP